jgi:hypothetical protein
MFWNGNTAIEGLSGKASGASAACGATAAEEVAAEGAETLQSAGSHFTPMQKRYVPEMLVALIEEPLR